MHVESHSCGISAYERCGPTARTQSKRERAESRPENPPPAETPRAEPRRNPLVAAMMEAVKSLVPAQGAAASSATTGSATPATATGPTASTDAAGTLKEAALAFAHALYGALRSTGEGSDKGSGSDECRPRHAHCDRAYGRSGRGGGDRYDDLPARLEALAQQLVGTPAATANPAAATGSTAVKTSTAAGTSTTATPTAAAATEASVASTTAAPIKSASIQVAPPKALVVAAATENPLVTAFRQLFEALNAKPVKADTGSESTATTGSTAATSNTGAAGATAETGIATSASVTPSSSTTAAATTATTATDAPAAAVATTDAATTAAEPPKAEDAKQATEAAPDFKEKLASFLRLLAQTLREARGEGAQSASATGSLIDVAA
jgi:hypothetical protein